MTTDALTTPHRRLTFLATHLWIPLAVLLPLLLVLEMTNVDQMVTGWFFDEATQRFPLHYDATFEIITHHWAKYVVVLIACAVIGAWLMSFILPALKNRRTVLLFLGLAMTLAPATVSFLKSQSHRSCPYDLAEYGGNAPYVGLFKAAPPGDYAGRCFPSGHASAGFCLFAFYFAGLALRRRRLAMAGLWGGFAAGMLFGLARIAQGAHFLSHNLWSGLVCWLVVLAIYVLIFGPQAEPSAAPVANRAPG
ncbi:MAG TPA: phosphatase PAP2 family protein [Burkholderiales bacterium]|nr:phosphatase PAP2 family protein [Burkholderiales bacterium]